MSALDDIWTDDLLRRREDAEFLISFLSKRIEERRLKGRAGSFVLNIDAGWGYGKSFFLDRLGLSLEATGNLVARVNAWRDDHADDPLVAVMSAVDDTIKPLLATQKTIRSAWNKVKKTSGQVTMAVAKGAAEHWAKKLIGDGVTSVVDAIRANGVNEDTIHAAAKKGMQPVENDGEEQLAEFRKAQTAIKTFRDELAHFLKEIKNDQFKTPLFVLVDELDRCRPSYAIALLERVKHLFDIDNVIFLIATDTSQLKHAIGAVYGAGFDSERYLFRFFDFVYRFDQPSLGDFVAALAANSTLAERKLSLPPDVNFSQLVVNTFQSFDLSLRDAEQCFESLRNIVTVWDMPIPLELSVLLPFVIANHFSVTELPGKTFAAVIQDFRISHSDGLPDWRVPRRVRTANGLQPDNIEFMVLFRRFLEAASEPLPIILKREPAPNTVDIWIHGQLKEEYRKRGQTAVSVITRYRHLARTAGRLQLPKI